jgi:hypothetical protein
MDLRVVTALAASALPSFAAPATSPALAAPSRCQSLRGADRAPDRNVKLVKRSTRDRLADGSPGSTLVGCVLPRGRLFTIARRKGVDNDLAQEFEYAIRQVAGRTVALDTYGTRDGRAVAALQHFRPAPQSPTDVIVGFASDGTRRLLDAGALGDLPAASLGLTGDVASWTHAGAPRSARQ